VNVLFVCSGNICRSPMAEACLRRALAGESVAVASAGTLGIEGAPAAPEAVRALEEIGIDLSDHRSQGVTRDLLERASIVVTMERAHLLDLLQRFGPVPQRRHLIREFERGPAPREDAPDLPDPVGLPIGVYRGLLQVLQPCIEHLATHLRELSRRREP
jgi:protein-tyrosine phosphatase